MNCFKCGLVLLGVSLIGSAMSRAAVPPANLIMNGAFEAGNQYWHGDGKVVTLPDGNKVYQLDAAANRLHTLSQPFRMHGLKEIQIVFRARNVNYTGKSLRIAIHRPGGGSVLFDRDLPDDGNWKEFHINYNQNKVEEERVLSIDVHEGSGTVQIDDVEVRDVTEKMPDTPAKPATPNPAVANNSKTMPVTPVAAPKANPSAIPPALTKQPESGGDFTSLEQMVDGAPASVLSRVKESRNLPDAVAELNEYFTKNLLGRRATIKGRVAATKEISNRANKFAVNYVERCVGPNTGNIQRCWFWAYFTGDVPEDYRELHEGSETVVSGEISHCEAKVAPDGNFVRLNVNLDKSKIVTP